MDLESAIQSPEDMSRFLMTVTRILRLGVNGRFTAYSPHRFFCVLFLTLCNMFFIVTLIIAYRRKYYTETLVYACALLASILYHACEGSHNSYTFCMADTTHKRPTVH